jgi:hypothetical protein
MRATVVQGIEVALVVTERNIRIIDSDDLDATRRTITRICDPDKLLFHKALLFANGENKTRV